MKVRSSVRELKRSVARCDACILYAPFKEEIDYRHASFPLPVFQQNLMLPPAASADPFWWAEKCKTQCATRNPYILIPGRRFDLHGTRYGKGGGWYDRFLSRVPHEWVRIGMAHATQLSRSLISRSSWDEPVDWVLTYDGSAWDAHHATETR